MNAHTHTYTHTLTWLLACMALGGTNALAAGKAHQHGVMKADVVIDGNKLAIAMEVPLDNLLGFERAPRNDAERKAAADVLARLRSPDKGTPLFVLDAAAGCSLSKAEVSAPVLEPKDKAASTSAAKDGHADLEASYEFTCSEPKALRTLELGLFDAYRRMQRIDVQVAGAQGQSKTVLRRPARSVRLVR